MAAITICSDFGAPKIKSDSVSTDSPSISHEVMGPDAMIEGIMLREINQRKNEYWMILFTWKLKKKEATHDYIYLTEIKRCLLLGRKVMTNLDSIFKSRDTTLPTKVRLVKAMVFPVVLYGCESWTLKKAEHRRIDAFELWH